MAWKLHSGLEQIDLFKGFRLWGRGSPLFIFTLGFWLSHGQKQQSKTLHGNRKFDVKAGENMQKSILLSL